MDETAFPGERAHYELAAGRPNCTEASLATIENSTADTRLIPEQIWDSDDIPERELFRGKITGSACPMVWARSEYIKLRRSLAGRQSLRPACADEHLALTGDSSALVG